MGLEQRPGAVSATRFDQLFRELVKDKDPGVLFAFYCACVNEGGDGPRSYECAWVLNQIFRTSAVAKVFIPDLLKLAEEASAGVK